MASLRKYSANDGILLKQVSKKQPVYVRIRLKWSKTAG